MSRPVKFRCWDKDIKEYGQPFTKFVVAQDSSEYEFMAFKFGNNIISLSDAIKNPQRFTLEQYTGLKDKNGEEGFDGDRAIYPLNDLVGEFTIVWGCGGYYLASENKSLNIECLKDREIIGNIHE